MTLEGVKLDFRNVNVSRHMKIKISDGVYESEETSFIDKYITSDMDVIDLGGGLGFTACFANQRINSKSTHIVVEANKKLITTIKNNRNINNCDFEIYHAAYSTKDNLATIEIPKNVWGGSLFRNTENVQTVDTVTLELLMSRFDLSKFALIADIEGAEADLIKNELHILEAYCPILIIEFHHLKDEYTKMKGEIAKSKDILEDSSFTKIEETSGVAVYENEQIQ